MWVSLLNGNTTISTLHCINRPANNNKANIAFSVAFISCLYGTCEIAWPSVDVGVGSPVCVEDEPFPGRLYATVAACLNGASFDLDYPTNPPTDLDVRSKLRLPDVVILRVY